MRSFLITLCFLAFLATPVYLLECYQCYGNNKDDCVGSYVTCPNSDQVCYSWIREDRTDQRPTYFRRSCGRKEVCGYSGTYGSLYGRVRESITCCDSDSCTPEVPVLPTGSTERNGLLCPVCYDHDKDCHADYGMYCIGDEHYCYRVTVTSDENQEPYVGTERGCATKSICDINTINMDIGNGNQQTFKVECSGGTRLQVYSALIFLVLAVVWVI